LKFTEFLFCSVICRAAV